MIFYEDNLRQVLLIVSHCRCSCLRSSV